MTAEVGVMNPFGVGLAADSASTVNISTGTKKIFTSAEKLFQLSSNAPVGIMIYGNASLLNLPWETLVKNYNKKLIGKVYPRLEDYAIGFFKFIKNNKTTFTNKNQSDWVRYVTLEYYGYLRSEFLGEINNIIKNVDEITDLQIKRMFTKYISDELAETMKLPKLDALPTDFSDRLKSKYSKQIREDKAEVFHELPVSKITERRLIELVIEILSRSRIESNGLRSGVVFAGFGEKENFPSLIEYPVSGMACGYPLYRKFRHLSIGDKITACVVPFAQVEVVNTFMDGIDPNLFQMIVESVKVLFDQVNGSIISEVISENKRFGEKLEKVVNKNLSSMVDNLVSQWILKKGELYSQPIMNMVATLPKDELGAMAESLVNLTKFKRKISTDLETVGGPIDVAVITKGDGFVWINRKQYFPPELNNV